MPTIGRDIIPAHLALHETPRHYDGDVFDNVRVRFGEVQGIVYPDDAKSRSKTFAEYSVYVQYRSNGVMAAKLYENCVLVNQFGGLADQETFTLRFEKNPSTRQKGMTKLGKGSKVLIACINGETERAVIIGGVRDPQDSDKDLKDNGHNYHWLFNGVSLDVNKDGEVTLKYSGATDIDGKTSADSSKTGSLITLDKDGHVIIKHRAGVLTGEATDHTLLGESYRKEQQKMHNQLLSLINTLKGLLQTAGAALTTASTTAIPPFTPPVAVAPAGVALTTAANVAGQMAQAIQDFEQAAGQKNSFLSKDNKSD